MHPQHHHEMVHRASIVVRFCNLFFFSGVFQLKTFKIIILASPQSTSTSIVNSEWKLRKPMIRSVHGSITPDMHLRRHSGKSILINFLFFWEKYLILLFLTGANSLHQSRTKQIHQSNGSIQSDSPSSNSISPAPSPSPRPQSANANNSGSGLGKRWNSTGDFGAHSNLTGRYCHWI